MTSVFRTCISTRDLRYFIYYSALTGRKCYTPLIRHIFGCSTPVARKLLRAIQKKVWKEYRISVYSPPCVTRKDIDRMSVLFRGFHESIPFRHMVRMCARSGKYADRDELVNALLSYARRVGFRYRRKEILRLLRSERFWAVPKPRTSSYAFRERLLTRYTLLKAYYTAGFRTRNLRYTLRGRSKYGMRSSVCEWFGIGLLELRKRYENGWTFSDFLNLLEGKVWERVADGVRELYRNGLRVPRKPDGTFARGEKLPFAYERLCRYVGRDELYHIYETAKSEEEFIKKVRKTYISSWLDTYYT